MKKSITQASIKQPSVSKEISMNKQSKQPIPSPHYENVYRISKTINYDNEYRTTHYLTSKFLSFVDRLFGAVRGDMCWL